MKTGGWQCAIDAVPLLIIYNIVCVTRNRVYITLLRRMLLLCYWFEYFRQVRHGFLRRKKGKT